ncbi:50S ribosomal protein L3 [Candidatus Arcanobacter lacustris]|jgi:large subunit ribosomal protein L3|uniref:Large ribosomal subunit protein uL3 n=1 Tax=Candidatus Arcanibacter lacustris TaxID=1607817 RepID=A0A0F5MQT6_9RICK|nr:50S ribosomal protein L3 [Candidatus Arcanobacter lacustris]
MRVGVVAEKLGMSALYDEQGVRIPVTLLKLDSCMVVGAKSKEVDGYDALQVGIKQVKINKLSNPLKGHFAKNQVEPRKKLVEFRMDDKSAMVEVGSTILATHFVPGQYVDVSGVTVGKGFAGAMKRHNFRGLEATHGVSVSHRSHGSTGQRQDPGKVFKGKKMAGHMGVDKVTVQNLEIVASDSEKGLIVIKGAVPGHKGSYIIVRDAIKRALPEGAPYPASLLS